MDICRTCAEQSGKELVPIFSKLEDKFIANVIVDCSSVTINEDDGLPSYICSTCLASVKEILRFAQKVRESDRKLRLLLKGETLATGLKKQEQEPADGNFITIPLELALAEVKLEVEDEDAVDQSLKEDQTNVLESDQESDDFEDGNDSDWKSDGKTSDDEPVEEEVVVTRRSRRKTAATASSDQEDNKPKRRRWQKPKKGCDEEDDGELSDLDEVEQQVYKLVQAEPNRFFCCLCYKDYETRGELVEHGKQKHSKKTRKVNYSKKYACDVCFCRYVTKDALTEHQAIVAKLSSKKIYECLRCSNRFATIKRRRYHAHNHPKYAEASDPDLEEKQKRLATCCKKGCYKKFTTKDELLEHAKKEHSGNRSLIKDPTKPHECPVCFKGFEKLQSMKRHRYRMFESCMQCSICGREFKSRNSMITHERKHNNEKPFACEVCGKRFAIRGQLKHHMAVHKDDKPFVCAVCGWSFKRECNLKIHMLQHSDTLPWKCEVCGKCFKIVEDDNLPSQICRPCLTTLQQTTTFVQLVRSSDRKLRKALEGDFGKAENDDSAEDNSQDQDDEPPWQIIQMQLDGIKKEEDQESKDEADFDGVANSSRVILDDAGDRKIDSEDVEFLHDERNDDQSDKESNSESFLAEKQTRRNQKSKIINETTDSDSDDGPPKKRRRQRRSRKFENDIEKGDESEDESIPDDRLRKLYKSVQVEANTHLCCACLKIFINRSELIEHGRASHTKKKYINESKTNICDVCFRRYSKPGPLEAHKQSFVGLDVVYECFRCLTRVIAQNRHQHARIHLKHMEPSKDDDKSKREQRCCAKDCSVICSTEELLITHGREAHIGNKAETDDPQRRFECPVCYKRFEKREALTRHRHRMYRATHQCAVCGKEFKNRYEMLVHERNHENRKPYSCEICGKRFNSKEAVRVHMLVHSDSKPFSCTVCGWRFRRKCNLNKHASKHREDTPFECSVCQKTFKGKYHLQYHMRIHTGHKPWQCRYCEKSFADHANRARHETSHTGIKPYKCSYCDKSFIRRRFQIEHESTHTGIKPYRCEMCNRTFSQKSSLKKHLEMHPLAPENQLSLEQPSPMPADLPMSPPPPPLMTCSSTAVSSSLGHQQNTHTVAMVAASATMAPSTYQQM